MRLIALWIIALVMIPAAGSAQASAKAPASAFAASPPSAATALRDHKGPTIEAAAVGVRLTASPAKASAPRTRARRSGIGHAGALIIVGGGAMVAGSVIDGDAGTVFLVGGALIALWGLYQLVQ